MLTATGKVYGRAQGGWGCWIGRLQSYRRKASGEMLVLKFI